MTDLMKRYEAETGKVMSRLMEIFADAEKHSKEELINVMTELYMYGLHLEAQLTWQLVSEKPKENDEDYFTRSAKGDVVKMRYHDGMFFIWDDEVSMYFLPMDKPKYWLPIPPALEEK